MNGCLFYYRAELPAEFQAAPEILPEAWVKNGLIPGGISGGA